MSPAGPRFARAVGCACAALVAGALAFRAVQNGYGPVGGAISLPKLGWLALTILFWLVLPAFVAADARVPSPLRLAFRWLLGLMAARGVVELWMLYVTHDWSPWYGIAHDVACVAVLGLLGARAVAAGVLRAPAGRLVATHLAVTAAMFLPEIGFAHYMLTHFRTTGEDAIYFVPDEERHRAVLDATAAAVAAVGAYLPWFLWRWLRGTPERAPATAR